MTVCVCQNYAQQVFKTVCSMASRTTRTPFSQLPDEQRRAAIEQLREIFERQQAVDRAAGQLKQYLQLKGFSQDRAEHITDKLEIYRVEELLHLEREDVDECLPDLTEDEKRKFLHIAQVVKDNKHAVLAITHPHLPSTRLQNQYLVVNKS